MLSRCPAVLLSHGQALNNEDQLHINPGSATGAYSTFSQSTQPSFVLMDLDGSKVCVCGGGVPGCSVAQATGPQQLVEPQPGH